MNTQRSYDLVKVADVLARDLAITNSRTQVNELIDTAAELVGERAMFAVLRSALTTLVGAHLHGTDVVDRFELTAGADLNPAHLPSLFDPESLR